MTLADRWPLADHLDLRDELLGAWDRPGYHDLRHLTEVLDHLDELRTAGVGFDDVTVGLAAWFHDAVYDSGAGPEERSAQWALRTLPAPLGSEVARLVRVTAHHRPEFDDPSAGALSDADLAILAAPAQRYAEYVAGVRAEHADVAEPDFRAGRRAVLVDLQAKGHLFETPQARDLWERAARANLAREVLGLSEP